MCSSYPLEYTRIENYISLTGNARKSNLESLSRCDFWAFFCVLGVKQLPKKIVLAVGNKDLSAILSKEFTKRTKDFILAKQEILHINFLEEIVDMEKPDILLVHDFYLESSLSEKEEREVEWLNLFKKLRYLYDDSIRIAVMCERPKGDPFLSQLVSLQIFDIFNTNMVDVQDMMEQLEDKPRFAKAASFLTGDIAFLSGMGEAVEEDVQEKAKIENSPAPVKPVINKIIEKKVVQKNVIQKVVNKNVIKRNYNLHVHQSVDKVVGVPIQKQLLLVGSIFPKSGATFFSHLLAREIASYGVGVTYIESPFSPPYTYDRFDGRNRVPNYLSKFYSLQQPESILDKSIQFDWEHDEVGIIAKHPLKEDIQPSEQIAFEMFVKLLYSSSSTYTIIDIGTDWTLEVYQDLLEICNDAFIVIEPDLAHLQYTEESQEEIMKFFRESLDNEKIGIIGNRFDPKLINYPFFDDLLGDALITTIPVVSSKDVFESQYNGEFINNLPSYENEIKTVLRPIIESLLPEPFLKQKKGSSLLKGLFSKKVRLEKTTEN